VQTRYPLGPDARARAFLHFFWEGEQGQPSAHVSILIQLFVDSLASALARCSSELAPVTLGQPSDALEEAVALPSPVAHHAP